MKTNFWKLISDYSIEIPIIQRDYAQGRESERKIAEKFIDDLFDALVNNKKLSLDFIYGKTNENTLIPIDGQQRLTTLFLLHWYLALKENKLNEENKNILLKFSYETRLTSQDFCKKLIDKGIIYNQNIKKISDIIKDANWYYLSWEQDPTVVAMLNMLDIIHSKFRNFNSNQKLFDKLTNDDSPIEFYFLPLENFSLTDELYIKMNARGIPLTYFENFKAQFSELLDNKNKAKLDNEWLDIFWKIEKEKNSNFHAENVDIKFYNFFENITLLLYVEKNEIDKEFKDNYNLFSIWDKDKKSINNNLQNEINVFTNDNIELIIKCLNCLEKYNDEDKIFSNFIKPNKEIDYWELVRFYSLFQFFIKNGNITQDNNESYERWIRVTSNLINNTLIQSPDDFYKAVQSIKKLSDNIDNLYNYLSNTPDIDFFTKNQVDEEKIKAKLILEDHEWKDLILNIEKHPYFNGQIGFILEFSKDNDGSYNKEKFEDYSEKLNKLFSDFKNREDYLFERALLSIGNYLVEIGSNLTFCSYNDALRAKIANWRKVFNDSVKSGYLKILLDKINIENIENSLNKIIKDKTNEINDWRKYFINNPENIKYCKERQIRYYNTDTYPKIYLLSKIQLNGWHAELYTYDLYIKFKNEYENIEYIYSNTYDEPYISINKNNFSISIENDNSNFKVSVQCENNNELKQFKNELDRLGLIFEVNNGSLSINLKLDEIEKIKDILSKI